MRITSDRPGGQRQQSEWELRLVPVAWTVVCVLALGLGVLHLWWHKPGESFWLIQVLVPAGPVLLWLSGLYACRETARRKREEHALRRTRDELELRLQQRTEELATANEQLNGEIEQRRRVEEQARQHLAELAHAGRLSTTGRMVSELIHEINQPLYVINNYAQACSKVIRANILEGRAADKAEELLHWTTSISRHAGRAGKFMQRWRRFLQNTPPRPSAVSINELIEEVLELVEGSLRKGRIRVRWEPAATLPLLVVDRIQIEQVVLNLVQNAIEALEEADPDQRHLLIETGLGNADTVQVAVRDSGGGIASEDLERVFRPFYTTKPEGMGMGLAISQSIVETHGGRLWAARNPDHGTKFCFQIPTPGQEENP